MYLYVGSGGKKNVRVEDTAEESETKLKKRHFPGLCIPDNKQRVQTLLYDSEDLKVATKALTEASKYM